MINTHTIEIKLRGRIESMVIHTDVRVLLEETEVVTPFIKRHVKLLVHELEMNSIDSLSFSKK
jgi:hypothetical protein